MSTHVHFIEDIQGNLESIDWYCSEFCFNQDMHDKGEQFPTPGAYPGGSETNNCTYCANCNEHLWSGIEHDNMCDQCQSLIFKTGSVN